ncbi:hypothetical protein WDU94_007866 [Cyamophila willieti]
MSKELPPLMSLNKNTHFSTEDISFEDCLEDYRHYSSAHKTYKQPVPAHGNSSQPGRRPVGSSSCSSQTNCPQSSNENTSAQTNQSSDSPLLKRVHIFKVTILVVFCVMIIMIMIWSYFHYRTNIG